MEILYVFLPRWAAAWAVVSVRLLWMVWSWNLRPSEMLDQIYRIQTITGERVSNIVVMGSGEPMDNYDNVVRFIRLISSDKGLNISQRNLTISTCGIVPGDLEICRRRTPGHTGTVITCT